MLTKRKKGGTSRFTLFSCTLVCEGAWLMPTTPPRALRERVRACMVYALRLAQAASRPLGVKGATATGHRTHLANLAIDSLRGALERPSRHVMGLKPMRAPEGPVSGEERLRDARTCSRPPATKITHAPKISHDNYSTREPSDLRHHIQNQS